MNSTTLPAAPPSEMSSSSSPELEPEQDAVILLGIAVEQSPSQADTCGAEAKAEYGGGGAASGLDLLSAALASAPALPTC